MQESFYPVYNSVQNTPKMNQELDPNFKMFSLFYAYLSDNKRYISESLLVPYMTKSLILDFFLLQLWNEIVSGQVQRHCEWKDGE